MTIEEFNLYIALALKKLIYITFGALYSFTTSGIPPKPTVV